MDGKHLYTALIQIFQEYAAYSFLVIFLFISTPAYAQVENSGQILRAGTDDAQILLQEYLKPFGRGFGADMNSGWFTSARPLKTFEFDLRASVSASIVPVKDRTFNISELNLQSVQLLDGPAETPTVFGDNVATTILGSAGSHSSQQNEETYTFTMPAGSGYHLVPSPMAQLSVGLPGHTQTTIRYSPEVIIERDYSVRLFGIGGLAGINQLLFNGQLPIDISLQAGFMNLKARADFNILPPEQAHIEDRFPDSHWEGQAINLETNTFTSNLILSKAFSYLSIFGAVGYQNASTSIITEGPYPIVMPLTEDDRPSPNKTHEIQSVGIPIHLSLDGANSIHVISGLQLTLGTVSFSTSYSFSEYSTIRASIGMILGGAK